MKEFGPQGERASMAPPLDPPMDVTIKCTFFQNKPMKGIKQPTVKIIFNIFSYTCDIVIVNLHMYLQLE